MARKRRKRKGEKDTVPLPPETEIREIVKEEIVKEEIVTPSFLGTPVIKIEPPSPPKTKKIKYLGVDVLITRGPVTRERYRFTAKDRISEVAIEDYEGLLGKASRAHRCCGRKAGDPSRTVSGQSYFGPV